MASIFLISAERDSDNQIPELEEEEFIQDYYLTKTDKAFLNTFIVL
jgi:hypothetical protein